MESELKDLNPKSHQPDPIDDGSSAKDDRPLLKPDAAAAVIPPPPVSAATIEELEKKFAAYVRSDVYGTMGCGELPWTEKLLLGIAFFTLLPVRVAVVMTIMVVYYLVCRVCTMCLAPNREDGAGQEDYAHMRGWRRAVIVRAGKFFSRAILFVLGFYWINETHQFNDQAECKDISEEPERPGVIVSNHVSYLDILYHMSSSFPSFVAKRSVARLPIVGLISKCLGCVYVQRESKSSDFKGVSGIVNERIREAHQDKSAPMMMLFPEGTTTNGDFILPFKTGAFLAKAPVLPVILRYPYQRFSPAWDTISGVRHVILLFCQFVNYLEVTWLPIYYPSQQEKDDPKLYADNVRRLMASEGNLTMSDIGLAEKRIYHAALNEAGRIFSKLDCFCI
ncbi:lysophospholipid acyltransferase LPEAT1 isoform X2 [Rhododendron vialii]|uniref:lysophospholipid acyltransferase LPEAT1 isoform X2 n=1 Tax=Rhododendron vialii TaxID=182163 RepID=UPI00265F544F|nr:lysophospholipid acyltransferase LPEAT1 isoform X2 [Rhododendron vialii]